MSILQIQIIHFIQTNVFKWLNAYCPVGPHRSLRYIEYISIIVYNDIINFVSMPQDRHFLSSNYLILF